MLSKEPTKPQYKIFDTIVSWPIIRILQPIYEWKRSFWIYCFLGFLSTVSSFIAFELLKRALVNVPFSATIAEVLSWIISTLFSFVMFRYLYFDRTNNTFINELLKFIPTRLFTELVSLAVMAVFADIIGFNSTIIKIILIPVTAILNYLTSKFFVFKDKKN